MVSSSSSASHKVRELRIYVAGFLLEDHFRSLWVVEVVELVGLITCERVVFRHGAILLVVRRRSGWFPRRCRHWKWSAGQRTGGVWKRRGRTQREIWRKRENEDTTKEQTIKRSQTHSVARLEPCSVIAYQLWDVNCMRKMTCDVYLSYRTSTERPVFRHTRMDARIQREFCEWKSSWTQRLTREFFWWTNFGTFKKCGSGLAQHFPKDRNCEICWRTKTTRAPRRRRNVRVETSYRTFFGDLITADQKELSVKDVNLETIIDLQSWSKTWLPNGSSRIRAKQKLFRKHKGACKSSWSRIGSQKSFTLTIPRNLATLVKIFPGIIVRQHHTNHKQMGIAERAVRRVKEGTSAVLLQQGLDKEWWADSMEWYTYLRNIQDLLSDGKTSYERRFGEPCKRTDFSMWFTGWVLPYFCECPI